MNVGSSEVGISPVLLQAITLKSKDQNKSLLSGGGKSDMERVVEPNIRIKQEIVDNMEENNHNGHFVSQLLQNMNQPIENIVDNGSQDEAVDKQTSIDQNSIKNILKLKLGRNQVITSAPEDRGDNPGTIIITSNEGDISMVNVLSAIASQHMKATNKTSNSVQDSVTYTEAAGHTEDVSSSPSSSKQVIICYDNNAAVPSPVNDIVVSENSPAVTCNVVIDQSGTQYYMQEPEIPEDGDYSGPTPSKQLRQSTDTLVMAQDIRVEHQVMSTQGAIPPDVNMEGFGGDPMDSACPICGDTISGYHYGIFTCESCKGFFKRTVQNKKSFVCHRNADCEISKTNRKKCPSCRFTKCLVAGMKLEAIRVDRTRGGRSSYDGCSPHGRPKTLMDKNTPKPIRRNSQQRSSTEGLPKSLENVHLMLPSGEDISGSQLVAILNRSGRTFPEEVKPFVPQVLTEIMNLESILCEDEVAEIPNDKSSGDSDQNFFVVLLQLAELRLYKLVRWARNLPQFSAISTDDQILLLQNSWADLLILHCCWKSIQSTSEIFLPMGRSIDVEKARELGVEEIISRMLFITEQLRRLQVDQYEYVSLKVLILITPDVKTIKDTKKIQEQQEAICEALYQYTTSHYPQLVNKFGEMLLRLPELSRISMIGKEMLNTLLPPGFASCGLLFELLKGDGLKDDL